MFHGEAIIKPKKGKSQSFYSADYFFAPKEYTGEREIRAGNHLHYELSVSKYFSVDQNNIVIGGFSMGGYGSLRTFYENPELYKGVVVHAGHPDLANYWLGKGYPNFLDEKYLKPFLGKKVFVYHGKKDGSLPVGKIEAMIEKMKTMTIDVSYAIVDENGHQYPDKKTNKLYFEWLNKVIK